MFLTGASLGFQIDGFGFFEPPPILLKKLYYSIRNNPSPKIDGFGRTRRTRTRGAPVIYTPYPFRLLVTKPQDLLVLKNETSFIHSFKETLWFQAAVTSRRMERSTFVDVKSARPTVFLASWRPGRRKWVYRVHR